MKATYHDLCEAIGKQERPDLCVFWATPGAFRVLLNLKHDDGAFLVDHALLRDEDHRLLGFPLHCARYPTGYPNGADLIAFGPKDDGPKWEPLET